MILGKHTIKTVWTDFSYLLVSESPAGRLDSSQNHAEASFWNPVACSHSGPLLSDGNDWTSELRPNNHS